MATVKVQDMNSREEISAVSKVIFMWGGTGKVIGGIQDKNIGERGNLSASRTDMKKSAIGS